MTSSKLTGPGARPCKGRARGLRGIWLATVAAAAVVTPVAYAQQPDEEPIPSAEQPAPSTDQPPPSTEEPAPAPEEAVTTAPEARARARQLADTRGFGVVPTVGLEAAVTDNVALSQDNRKADFLLRALLGLDAVLNRGRTTGRLSVTSFYDQYARSNDFNGFSVEANADAALQLVKDVLSLEAHGAITNGRTTNFGAPAIDRSGVAGRVQYSIWDIGARYTGKLGDFADLGGLARFSQVYYSAADSSRLETPLPPDDSIWQAVARIDTAKRLRGYQLVTVAKYEGDDHGYNTVGALQSVYVNLYPKVRLIARAGYEHVEQENIAEIDAPVLSAGFEITPTANSKFSFEGGERYRRTAWAAHAEANFGEHIYLYGDYNEAVQPDQVFVVNSFQQFVDESLNLPPPIAPSRFSVQDNIYAQPSFNKYGDVRLLLINPRTSLELSAHYGDREFLLAETHDRTLLTSVMLTHALRPDLTGQLDFGYARTYSSPLYGESRSYAASAQLNYHANSTTDVTASYAYADGKELFAGGERVYDNSFLIAIRKRF
jgi:hypothetical protein